MLDEMMDEVMNDAEVYLTMRWLRGESTAANLTTRDLIGIRSAHSVPRPSIRTPNNMLLIGSLGLLPRVAHRPALVRTTASPRCFIDPAQDECRLPCTDDARCLTIAVEVAPDLIEAAADMLAPSSGLMDASDITPPRFDGFVVSTTATDAVSTTDAASASHDGATVARGALALVAAIYGSNYACVKLLDEWVGETSVAAALRFAVALAVMLPVLGHLGLRERRYVSWPFARDGLVVGSWFALGYCAQATALETSAAGLQAFLLALSVLVCPVLEALVDGKTQPRRVWYAAVLAACGVAALELDGLMGGGGAPSQGDLIGLLQPLFFGAGFFECSRAMERHSAGPKDLATPAALTAWQLVAVFALSCVWLSTAAGDGSGGGGGVGHLVEIVREMAADPAGHAAILGTVVWTGVGTTAGCSLVEAAALGELSSSEATVVFATEPLWGAAIAFFLLGETMGPTCQLGGALMVAACIVSATEASPAAIGASARSGLRWATESAGLAMGFSPALDLDSDRGGSSSQ